MLQLHNHGILVLVSDDTAEVTFGVGQKFTGPTETGSAFRSFPKSEAATEKRFMCRDKV